LIIEYHISTYSKRMNKKENYIMAPYKYIEG